MAISGSISLASNLSQTSPLPGGLPLLTSQQVGWQVVSGTAADQCDLKYVKTLTLAATPTVLDLTSLTDPFGAALSFARIKEVLITNTSTTDGQNLNIGYSSTTTGAFTGIVSNGGQVFLGPSTAKNQGVFLWVSPNTTGAVVNTTNKLLNLDPGSNTITIGIEICGCSV